MKQNYQYYAVARGHQIGIFEKVEDFKRAIDGYSNPKFFAHNSHIKVSVWFEKHKDTSPRSQPIESTPQKSSKKPANIDTTIWFANIFSDFKEDKLSWSVVVADNLKIIYEDCGLVEGYYKCDRIIGEMEGIKQAVAYAAEHDREIMIMYLMDALKAYAEGTINPTNVQIRQYSEYMSKYGNWKFGRRKSEHHPNFQRAKNLAEQALKDYFSQNSP